MNFSQTTRKLNKKAKLSKSLQHILLFFIRYISFKNISSRQNFRFLTFLSTFLLLILFKPTSAGAVSIALDGTRTVLSGTDCGIATYRFGSSSRFNGQALDILVEVISEDNDLTPATAPIGNCIYFSNNALIADLRDRDPAPDDAASMDLKITVVAKGTTTPVPVDRISIAGFDLDIINPPASAPNITGTDDIYFQNPDGTIISSGSNVTATTGSFFGQYQTKLKGQTTGDCADTPTEPPTATSLACRGAAMFVNGPGSVPNTVSSVILRVQNDNAYGDPNATFTTSPLSPTTSNPRLTAVRRFLLSLEISEVEELITNVQDYGDAASSYQTTGTAVSTNRSLGYGVLADGETNNQFSANALGDDTDGSTNASKFDDEEGVRLNNQPLNNQTLFTNTTTNLNVTTFGTGYLSAWLDLNQNGVFDTTEKVVPDQSITSTTVTNSTIPITIPRTATPGNTAIRFRFSEVTGVGATGLASNGEVEDYQVAIAPYDFGDAPDTYGTNSTNNNGEGVGANHVITSTLKLGTNAPDSETDAQTPLTGTGDDSNGTPDDEDGISTFPSLNTSNSSYSLTTTVNNTSGSAANVYGWLDFDRDGKFDGDERATVSNGSITLDSNGKVPTGSNGTVTLTWNNLGGTGANITDGNSYARIRLTTDNLTAASATTTRDAASVGNANNGEVEDYPIAIAQPLDFGDAPATFGDASHSIPTTPIVYLGAIKPDRELGTQLGTDSGASASGDDGNATPDDEDAFTTLPNVPSLNSYSLNVPVTNTSGGNATLHAWVDFDKNGIFTAGEYRSATVASGSTNVNLNWTIPTGILPGDTHVRFRLTTDTLNDNALTLLRDERSIGNATNGEVEDYSTSISIYDYGDAPDAATGTGTGNYQTTASDGGAAQVVISTLGQVLSLGSNIDVDNGILQNSTASADDTNGTPDDEDGVSSFPILTTTANQTYTVPVSVSNNVPLLNAYLVGYIDFNKDGDFLDTGEKSATVTIPTSSTNPRTFNVTFTTPTGVTTGNTYARFRLGSVQATAESATGASVSTDNGEIEDYQIAIAPARDYGDAPDTYGTDNTANNSSNTSDPVGANHIIIPGLFLGATRPDAETNGFVDGTDNNNGNAIDDDAPTGTGTGNGDDEDNFTLPTLTAGATSYTIPASNITVTNTATPAAAATLHAWIDFNKNGKFDSTEYASATVVTSGSNPQTNLTWSGITVGTVGNTYARFRLTSDSSINNNTPGGAANSGEVEDYQVAIAQPVASNPKLLLVKRITAINPGQPDAIQFNNFVNDGSPADDEAPNWPDSDSNRSNNINTYLRGAINVPGVKPGDEVEYTIYFLSNGNVSAKNVTICDVVPDNMTFVANSYSANFGMALASNGTTLPTTTNKNLSNAIGDDEADYYPPNTNPAVSNLCKKHDSNNPNNLILLNSDNNLSGAVLINLSDPIPPATGSGIPPNSYGFIRFRAKVK